MINNNLIQFVRDNKGNPKGVVVASLIDGNVRIGWSLTNESSGDTFDKDMGMRIAIGRINVGSNAIVPIAVNKIIQSLVGRSKKYFKTDKIIIVGK